MRSESGGQLSCSQYSPRVQDSDDTGVERRNSVKVKESEYNAP